MSADNERVFALATLGKLAAALVHEIKGPLAVAHGYTQLLQNRLPDDQTREICRKLRCQLEQIDHLVQGVLYVARTQRPNRQVCRPDRVVGDAVALVRTAALSRGVEIRLSCLGSVPEMVADPDQIRHLLLNLLLNALEAMPGGGIVSVRLRYRGSSGTVALTVADNGPGIPPHVRQRLFEPFVTGKEGGTGLGLAICRNIVEQHGGRIRIRSGPRGTAVRVLLPADRTVGAEKVLPAAGC